MSLLALPRSPRVARGSIRVPFQLASVVCLIIGCGRAVDSPPSQPSTQQTQEFPTPTAAPRLEPGDPASVPAADLKDMFEGVPAALRQGRSDVELARELGVRAWAIEFTEGPLNCWLEVEETGQHTTEARLPGPQGIFWTCPPERGRILLWFRPGASREHASARSQRIMKLLPETTEPISEFFVLSGAASSKDWSANPRLARWWSNWNEVSIKEIARARKVEGANEVTLLAIEATEKGSPVGAAPRKVKLALKARSAKPTKK